MSPDINTLNRKKHLLFQIFHEIVLKIGADVDSMMYNIIIGLHLSGKVLNMEDLNIRDKECSNQRVKQKSIRLHVPVY